MNGPDFETLLQSPLDEETEEGGWGATIAAFAAGAVVVVAVEFVIGVGSPRPVDQHPQETTTAASKSQDDQPPASAYPLGFTDIGTAIGLKPMAANTDAGRFVVSFASAVERGARDATLEVPIGGTWQLERSDGSIFPSTALIYDRHHTGVLAAAFPGEPASGDAVRMTERWDPVAVEGEAAVPFTGTPFTIGEAVTIELEGDITLLLRTIELGRHLGRIEWSLAGPSDPTGFVDFGVTLVDEGRTEVGIYVPRPEPRDPTLSAGVTDLIWGEGFDVHPDEAAEVRIEAKITLYEPVDVDIVFSLDSIPTG